MIHEYWNVETPIYLRSISRGKKRRRESARSEKQFGFGQATQLLPAQIQNLEPIGGTLCADKAKETACEWIDDACDSTQDTRVS